MKSKIIEILRWLLGIHPPMPLLYWVCPECGISLDIGERCECGKWQWGGDTNAQG